jgi:hypothetical protein
MLKILTSEITNLSFIRNVYKKNKWYSLLSADDLCSFYIFKSKKSTAKQIQVYLDSIENWLQKWRLMMAPHKCFGLSICTLYIKYALLMHTL